MSISYKDRSKKEIETVARKVTASIRETQNKNFAELLVKWAEELEAKGLMAKKALALLKEELDKVGVSFNACPTF